MYFGRALLSVISLDLVQSRLYLIVSRVYLALNCEISACYSTLNTVNHYSPLNYSESSFFSYESLLPFNYSESYSPAFEGVESYSVRTE